MAAVFEALSSTNVGTSNAVTELIERETAACYEVLAGSACPHFECVGKDESIPTEDAAYDKHLFHHRTYEMQALRSLASVGEYDCGLGRASIEGLAYLASEVTNDYWCS
ncbi:related to CDC5-Serine/threonine-protein kinase [Sporisorium scitamineum]|uniref:Related to CDC5-Serine/threonine-protein kinase n=1 Tax=Sporisorium scitamineum TaxID=49012 RepID=A0A127ZI11_9BASI|nr:related to CDC5-Serine/threonine-protein kinase [Sporisorium scitamineum]